MFEDLDLSISASSLSTTVSVPAVQAQSAVVQQEVADLQGFDVDLDALISTSLSWRNMYVLDQEVEAVYTEDGLWYPAKIDAVLDEPHMYRLTFVGYGNEQVTLEDQIRLPLAEMMKKKEEELAPAVAAELAKKAKRRSSYLAGKPPPDKATRLPSSAPPAPPPPTTTTSVPSVPADGLARRTSMNSMSAMFDQLVSGAAPPLAKSEPNPAAMQSGAMTAEERKALVMAEARKLGMENRGERRTVQVGGKAEGIESGDIGGLLDVEDARRRARSASQSEERKVWASNPLGM